MTSCSYPANITCEPCPGDAECPGGAVVVPLKGFWQSAANSTIMHVCPGQNACRDDDEDTQVRVCVGRHSRSSDESVLASGRGALHLLGVHGCGYDGS